MLIKAADDKSGMIAKLEHLAAQANGATRKSIEDELRRQRAGIKGEAESAYLIDFHFGETKSWAVIHDLRIRVGERVAQIDHLLINRFMECYVLETKHFHAGVKITEDGEFLRWNAFRKTYEGMPSPLLQNERHIEVLRKAVDGIELPTRLGIRIRPRFETLVLVAPNARIDRPTNFDASRVIKADGLKSRIWKDLDEKNLFTDVFATAAKVVGSDTLQDVARRLAALHEPIEPNYAARFRVAEPQAKYRNDPLPAPDPEDSASTPGPQQEVESGPSCKHCQHREGQILYGKYGYYFKCAACGGNTAIRFTCQPGHKPRLRKEGDRFYRECAECGTSSVFHQK
jgi:hypothetical protein